MVHQVIIRPATHSDIDDLVRVENAAWPPEQAFTREHFESHLKVLSDFPEGLQVAVVNNEIAGIGIAEILVYDLNNPIPTWCEVTDNGYLERTHNPNGNILYGVSLSVDPKYSTMRIGRIIIEAAEEVTIKYSLEGFILGSRVPRFYRYSTQMKIDDYILAKKRSRFLDPEIEFYSKCGLKIISTLPNYFDDPQSLNFGILMGWANPFRMMRAA